MIDRAKASGSFCIYPFTHVATKTDGSFKLCCRSEPIANVGATGIPQMWNGEDYKRVRRQMLSGERPPECAACWGLEDVGARSMRQRALREDFKDSRWNRYASTLQQAREDGTMLRLPRTLEIKISNLCNLKCRMCNPLDSSSWVSEWPEVEDLMAAHNTWSYRRTREMDLTHKPRLTTFEDNENWWREFEGMVEDLDMIEFAGGEPLIDPVHYRILDLLERRAPHIRLKYSTNLTHLTFKGTHIFERWRRFAGVAIYASMDGVFDVYDYIRTGAKFVDVVENLKSVTSATSVPFEDVAIACTIQIYNAFQLPKIIEFYHDLGVKFHTHRVTYPNFLNVQALPAALKSELSEEIERFKSRTPRGAFAEASQSVANKHLQDHLNFMNGRDESHLLPAFREFTRRMDRLRGTDAGLLDPRLRTLLREVST